MSPDEIHALGLKEVARLNAEMEKKDSGRFEGTLLEFFDYVRNKPELKPFKNQKKSLLILNESMP
jgi:uncharacterized protein (DUF885 family)